MFDKKIILQGIDAQQRELPNYYVDYVKGNENLFITFEAWINQIITLGVDREPWGFRFLAQKKGYSLLGIKIKQNDYYRKKDLHDFFRSAEFKRFISQFKKVTLYGNSMGGYAALAFAEAIPGCTVIAIAPQSTLDVKKVPWETRPGFRIASAQNNWESDFSDGAEGLQYAKEVTIIYDPFCKGDQLHVNRLLGNHVRLLKIPLMGHAICHHLNQMRILGTLIERIANNELSDDDFYQFAKARRTLPHYFMQLAGKRKSHKLRKACAERALSLKPTDLDAIELKCRCLRHERKFLEILVLTENILHTKGIQYAFEAYLELGKTKEATDLLTKFVDLSIPIGLHYLLKASKFAATINEFDLADQIITRAISHAPKNPKILKMTEFIKISRIETL